MGFSKKVNIVIFLSSGVARQHRKACDKLIALLLYGFSNLRYYKHNISDVYTPGIYAEGYIVFVFPFVCSFVRTSVTFVEFASKFCVKVSQVVYISATTHHKAFIFGP